MKAKLIKLEIHEGYRLNDEKGNLIASTLDGAKTKLSKQNCDEIFGVVDVDKLAIECMQNTINQETGDEIHKLSVALGFKKGFNKAMELNKDKVFTKQDIINYMNRVWEWCEGKKDVECSSATELRSKHIESIQPTEIEVEIEMEQYGYCEGCRKSGMWHCAHADTCGYAETREKPKLDSEGCLILKRVV
jgi:hypothetical protein